MEKEEEIIMEQEVDEDESLLLRKSRSITNGTVSHKINGHSSINGDKQEDEAVAKTENLVFYDRDEGKQVVKDYNLSSPNLQPSEILVQGQFADFKSSEEIESVEVDRIKGDELEVTEIDVEKVLQKQRTHDLYCPNCNSCITRRVILRKRKRGIRISDEEVKRNKIEAEIDPKSVTGSVQNQVNGVGLSTTDELPTLDDDVPDREPDIFRCLSCFSFFIPNGNGFKLFRIFGDKSVNENVRDEQVTSTKRNWFTSMFASNKQETALGQGGNLQTDARGSDIRIPLLSELGGQSDQPSSGHTAQVLAHSSLLMGASGSDGTPLLSDIYDQSDRPSSGQKAQVKAHSNLQTNAHGTDVRIPLLSESGDQLSSGHKARVLAHSNLQTDARESDVRIPLLSELDDQSDRPPSGQEALVLAQGDLHTGALGSDVRIPSLSVLDDQRDRPLSGQTAQVLAHSNLQTNAHGTDVQIPLLSKSGDQSDQLSSVHKARADARGSDVRITSLSELDDQSDRPSSGQTAQVLAHRNLQTDAHGSDVRIPLLTGVDYQSDRPLSGQTAQVLPHSNLQTDTHGSDVRIPLLSDLDDQSDRLSSGQKILAHRNLQTDTHGSAVRMPLLSDLDYLSDKPSSGQKAQVLAHTYRVAGSTRNNQVVESKDEILSFPWHEPTLNGKVVIGLGDKPDEATKKKIDAGMEEFGAHNGEQLTKSKYSKDVEVSDGNTLSATTAPKRTQFTNGEYAEDSVSFSRGGLKLLISSNQGNVNPPKSDERDVLNQTLQLSDTEPLPLSTSPFKAPEADGTSSNSVDTPRTVTEHRVGSWILTESAFDNNNSTLSIKETGKDTIITIDARQAESSQTLQGINTATEPARALESGTLVALSNHGRTEERKDFQIEIIKSVVYGGLGESIASLSIVSSAAGGGAATLNVLALAMANLIGGLFIIFHNLWELRNDCIEQVTNRVSDQAPQQRDRYKEVLGLRENFLLHALLAILSYFIFGLLPPVVYAFSFGKSNDKELKLLMVASASLICIIILAIGRAYVQTPHKRYSKTVLTFVILGFTVSGVSYAGGVFIERLLEKFHVFKPSSVSDLLLSES